MIWYDTTRHHKRRYDTRHVIWYDTIRHGTTRDVTLRHGTTREVTIWDKARDKDLLVVVQYGVHVLDPDGVHRPVKDQPLALLGRGGRVLPERVRQHAVRPLMGDWVEAAVQLRHADRLGVDDFGDNLGNKSLGVSSDQPILQPFTFSGKIRCGIMYWWNFKLHPGNGEV